ncbi:MAG TPA: hypothetical protein VLL97_14920, partial [Acidobacteriota bacterium]|nr:hypothetical protein [Acidobacteriota bacterium]
SPNAKYVKTIPFHRMGDTALFSTGADILGGMQLNIIYACGYATGLTGLSTKPHVHDYDEAVYFIGSDPYALDDLGAVVKVSIGPEGGQEWFTFDKPTVLVAPRGLWHCPIITETISRPYVCMAVSLTGKR